MFKRQGGVQDLDSRVLLPNTPRKDVFLVVHLHVNVCEAMGANTATTIAEGMGPVLANLVNAQMGPRIVSNLSPQRLSKVNYHFSHSIRHHLEFLSKN